MKTSPAETEDERASPLQSGAMGIACEVEETSSGSYHAVHAMYDAVVEFVHPQVRSLISARVGDGWKPTY